MVDLALAAAGGLPVCLKLLVPLQHSYAADLGTLTEWLVAKTANLGRDAVLAVSAAMKAKYTDVVDPLLTQEQIDALFRELVEDVLASEGLESFLTVTKPGGETPMVISVLRVSRFSQRNWTDIPVRWECVWFPQRGRGGANASVDGASGLLVSAPSPCG